MENIRSNLNISRPDRTKFIDLMPFFLDFYQYRILNKDESHKVDEDKYRDMVVFLQSRSDEEIEELAKEFILINSDNAIGKAISLPQLLEVIFRYARNFEEENNVPIKKGRGKKPRSHKDSPQKPLEYGYDKHRNSITGVITPNSGQILSAKVSGIIEQDKINKELAGQKGADLLRDLSLEDMKKKEKDKKDLDLIDSSSSDKLIGELEIEKGDYDKYVNEIKIQKQVDEADHDLLKGPLTIKDLIKRLNKNR